MECNFHQFALLPLELRRTIWELAAQSWTQDIHVLLAAPTEAGEERPFESRKHLFASEICMPPLLYACHDSRVAALQRYTLGLTIQEKTPWPWDRPIHYFHDPSRFTDCIYQGRIEEIGKATYWNPENDIVVLEHEIPPLECDANSVCNARPPGRRRCQYLFDARVRYLAITMDVWNCGSGNIVFDLRGLEVLFVLVDPKPCFAFSGMTSSAIGTVEGNFADERERYLKESCMIVEREMTETLRGNQALFRLKRGLGVPLKAEVVLVGSIDEAIEVINCLRNKRVDDGAKSSIT